MSGSGTSGDTSAPALSLQEKERRYAKVRKAMRAQGFDCLVLCAMGGSCFHEGNLRYFVGEKFKSHSHDEYVIFPLEGEPVLALTYTFTVHWAGKAWTTDIRAPKDPRGRDPRFASERSRSVSVAEILQEKGYAGAVIGLNKDVVPSTTYEDLVTNLPGAKLVDCSGFMIEMRRVKSEEEIAFVRRSGALADAAFAVCKENARAGVLEQHFMADWVHVLQRGGCEKSYDLLVADPVSPAIVRLPEPGKAFVQGDTIINEISPCYGGYFTQMNRTFVIGSMHPKLQELAKVCQEAQDAAAAQLRPGVSAGQVARAMEAVVKKHGCIPLLRGGHTSTGLDLMEIPLHPDDDTILETGMCMILHPTAAVPGFKVGDPGYFGPGDTFVITQTGAERVTRCPQDIVFSK